MIFYVNAIPLIFFSFSLLKEAFQEAFNYDIFPLCVISVYFLNKLFLHGLQTFLSSLRGKEGIC